MDCPVCKLPEKNVAERAIGDRHEIECARCGRFSISGTALAMARARKPDFRLAGWIRDQNELAHPPTLVSTDLDTLVQGLPPRRVSEKQILLLRAIERRSDYAGANVHLVPEFDLTLAWCSSVDEFNFILRALLSRGLVQLHKYSDPSESFSLEVTILSVGWQLLDDTAKPALLRNQVFVAMSFAQELNSAWAQGIQPAVRRAAYEPYRIDADPHIDRIDAKIIAEIKNSRFLIADVTQQRAGVYFEAGFALGLGLPVFWTVRKDDLSNVHFDTRQYNHIVWEHEAQLAEKLYEFIAAVVGTGGATSKEAPRK